VIRNPDKWAAVCIGAGGPWYAPVGAGLGRNVAYVPVRIWHGDADGTVPVSDAYLMEKELRCYGNEPVMRIVKGAGHAWSEDEITATRKWLLQHTRKRPDSFAFMCDDNDHRGAWGIIMSQDPAINPTPSFDCRIVKSTVYIRSQGTPGLYVELGEKGLNLKGPVTVYWNGEKAYEGPVKEISLGSGGGWRP